MINGTQFITALGAEGKNSFFKIIPSLFSTNVGVERALLLARQADIISALSTEALRGTVRNLHPS
jgi:histidine ammonia-lyase